MERRVYTREEVAVMLGVTSATLSRWKRNGEGPRCLLVGGRVLYPVESVDEFLSSASAGASQ